MRQAKVLWVFLLLIAVGLKSALLFFDRLPFNADEAIVALMGRHILLNGERPIFFYGQAYMGSLDAFLVAMGFALFGFHVWVIRAVQIILYLLVIFSTFKLSSLVFGQSKGKWYSVALLAVPTVNVTLYTTVSLGGYGEALVLGNLILYWGLKLLCLLEKGRLPPLQWWGGLGFWIGFGLWVNGLTGIYTLPVLVYLTWVALRQRGGIDWKGLGGAIGLFSLAVLLGSLPWWLYAFRHGISDLLAELFGSAIAMGGGNWFLRVVARAFNLLIFGGSVLFGLRPPWEIRWLALPLAPFALTIWLAILGQWISFLMRHPHHRSSWVLSGVALTFSLAFVSTPFGADPSGRYFLPLWVILALIAGEMIVQTLPRALYQCGVLGVIVLFNLWGVIECALRYPPGLTTQFDPVAVLDHRYLPSLIRFLRQNHETRGYSNYWVAYPLAFQSAEQIIYSPRLPYHADLRYTPRDDRYKPYTELVKQSDRIAYITTKNPALDEYLSERFRLAGIQWQEAWIGDYHIFYRLSRAIHPFQIGLGEELP